MGDPGFDELGDLVGEKIETHAQEKARTWAEQNCTVNDAACKTKADAALSGAKKDLAAAKKAQNHDDQEKAEKEVFATAIGVQAEKGGTLETIIHDQLTEEIIAMLAKIDPGVKLEKAPGGGFKGISDAIIKPAIKKMLASGGRDMSRVHVKAGDIVMLNPQEDGSVKLVFSKPQQARG